MRVSSKSSALSPKNKYNLAPFRYEQFLAVSTKSRNMNEGISAIEDVSNSYLSGDEWIQEFKQFGLETVNVDENSDSHHIKNIEKGKDEKMKTIQKKNSDFESILDFSHMHEMKKNDFVRTHSRVRSLKTLRRMESLGKNMAIYKNNWKELKLNVSAKLSEIKKMYSSGLEQCVAAAVQKTKQLLKKQQKQSNLDRQKFQQLYEQNVKLKQEQRLLKEKVIVLERNESAQKMKQNGLITQRIYSVDALRKNKKIQQEMEFDYEKQSQAMRNLNKQVLELNTEIQKYKSENKYLQKALNDSERKLKQKIDLNKDEDGNKKIQMYNSFMQKIEQLQEQIKELRESEEGLNMSQREAKSQMNEIQQFLQICERKQRELQEKQRRLILKQQQLQWKVSQKYEPIRQNHQNMQQNHNSIQWNRSSSNPRISTNKASTPKTKQVPYHEQFFSEAKSGGYFAKPLTSAFNRPQAERSNMNSKSKFTNQLNSRIMRIQSNLVDELNSLSHRF